MFDPKTKILVIDDMLTMRKVVSKCCRDLGFSDITEAPNGEEAWTKIQEANPPFQLIISDWNMPKLSGVELLKKVRADARFSKTPFVLVTAESEKEQVVEAIKAGVTNYVTKPFTVDTLREKLEAAHKKSAAAA